jgi:hypothetical protein
VGRIARIAAMGAKSVKYDSSGNSALPKLSSNPTRSAPISAPFRLPMPPTMTTTKAYDRISKSAPGYTLRKPPATTPATAASAAPRANTPTEMAETSMPTPRAISASSTAARIRAPTRVRSTTSHRITATAAATAMRKTR